MTLVVFLRGVNVGGKRFSPRALAEALGGRSLGAAGTFVVPGTRSATALRAELRERLPFEAEAMIRPSAEVAALVRSAPFGRAPAGAKPFVTVLAWEPARRPRLPLVVGAPWELRVVRQQGPYVLSWRKPGGIYANEVVERAFGVPATTRGWATFEAVGRALGP